MSLPVAAAYDAVATAYAARFGDVEVAHPLDRALVDELAALVGTDALGPVLDAGCGPGHWTGHLAATGLEVTGIDLSAELLVIARRDHPGLGFEQGSIAALPTPDASLGGVLAWFSLIHAPPVDLPGLLTELARVLAPGGRLLVGFQTTAADRGAVEEFDHAVAPAWRWPVDSMATLLRAAGFVEHTRLVREPGVGERRRVGHLLATRV